MATYIEQKYYELMCRMASEIIKKESAPIDWERRRYEIAKEVMANAFNSSAKFAVAKADELIAELKNTTNDGHTE